MDDVKAISARIGKELTDDDFFYEEIDYPVIIDHLGTSVFVEAYSEYGGWEGDWYVLYRDGDRFGYLQIGWGSCPACDALQACFNVEDLQELIDYIRDKIIWFDSNIECLRYFKEHDWEGEYGHCEKFNQECMEYLKNL